MRLWRHWTRRGKEKAGKGFHALVDEFIRDLPGTRNEVLPCALPYLALPCPAGVALIDAMHWNINDGVYG